MRNQRTRQIALCGILFALALVLGYFESILSAALFLPPGVKLGLANVVVMYALFFLNRRYALTLVLLKAGFGALTRGAVAGLMSLSGGLVSLLIMVLLMLPKRRPSILVLSVVGALGHNIGQLITIRLLLGTFSLYYAPVLLVAGVVTGSLTAGTLRVLLPAMRRAGVAPTQDEDDV